MTEQERADRLSMQVFANRFQNEKLGLVYYSKGLGRGGRIVTSAEANDYLERYARLLARNRRWLTEAAYLMFAGLVAAVVAAYFWLLYAAIFVLTLSVVLFFAGWLNALFGPSMFERRVARELSRRVASAPLSRAESIERGFALPHWKNVLFYGVGGPLLLFVLLHRAGPHGLVALLGQELAHQYDIAFKLFAICLFFCSLGALPYLWWKQHRRKRN